MINFNLNATKCLTLFLHLRLSGWTKFSLVLFTCFWIWTIVRYILDVRGLIDMYNFYTYLLGIPDVRMLIHLLFVISKCGNYYYYYYFLILFLKKLFNQLLG